MAAFRIFRRLRELLDVDLAGIADGDSLTYDQATQTFLPGAGGGGSQPTTETVDLTVNRAGGFEDTHAFDLEHVTAYRVTATLTSSDGDGETFGTDEGEIAFDLAYALPSADGSGPIAGDFGLFKWIDDVPGVTTTFDGYGLTPRYVLVKARIIKMTSFDLYDGANDPSLAVHVAIEYL